MRKGTQISLEVEENGDFYHGRLFRGGGTGTSCDLHIAQLGQTEILQEGSSVLERKMIRWSRENGSENYTLEEDNFYPFSAS